MDDIMVVEITDDMMAQAKAEQHYYQQNKQSDLTVNLRDDHDLVGSLAHQAAEVAFSYSPYGFETTRKQQHVGGDKYDIKFGDRIIDVKHASGKFNPLYCYNHNCSVTKREWDNKLVNCCINWFVFVNVDFTEGKCFVLGAMCKDDFDEQKVAFMGKVEGYQVKSRQLMPIRKFIYG